MSSTDFYHKKVIYFDDFVSINFDYDDIDILLKSLELFCYNMKNVYLLKEDNNAIKQKSYKISILYNLILSSYTLHIDNKLKKEEEKKEKVRYCRYTIDRRNKVIKGRGKKVV